MSRKDKKILRMLVEEVIMNVSFSSIFHTTKD